MRKVTSNKHNKKVHLMLLSSLLYADLTVSAEISRPFLQLTTELE